MLETERAAKARRLRIDSKISQLFPDGETYTVFDDEMLSLAGTYYGFQSVPLADAAKLPNDANVVLFLRNNLVTARIRRLFENARVLVVPIGSFDPSLEAALYAHRLTMATDFAAASNLSGYWVNSLTVEEGCLVFRDSRDGPPDCARTNLQCSLSDELAVDAWLRPVIATGEWVGIGTLCEVSVTAPSFTDWDAFRLDGTAVASGVLVAEDARHAESVEFRFRAARELRDELAARGPIILRLDDDVLTSVQAGGDDFTEAVAEVTNPAYGLHPTELGIGTNLSLLPHVNWRVNSQLNEGAGVLHIGFGEGITGAHMDFIVAKSEHSFAVTAPDPDLPPEHADGP